MTTPTPAELALLNTVPQRTQLYLSIYQPAVVLACQVSGTYDPNTQSVGYDNVTTGSYTNIHDYDYLVALVGTTAGDNDLGRTWVRSATANTLRFLESGHINWQDGLYITILNYTEIVSVYPRIIQDPDNQEDVIFYKIWDIPYVDQNTDLGSFICMGSDYAGWMEGGTGTAYFSASGTYNLNDNPLNYTWNFEGAITTGSFVNTPGNISWNQPGCYRVTLEVSSSSGSAVDRSIRYVSWHNQDFPPISNWELKELGGNREAGGYTARIRVRERVDIQDNALVVIFKDDWYGSTNQSISKNAKGRESILFVGYVLGGTIHQDYRDNSTEFELVSPTGIMAQTTCFGVSVEDSSSPSTWYEVQNLNVERAIHHYLRWHSSVLQRCDVEMSNLNDRYIQFFDADRTSLYDAINSVMDSALRGRAVSDSQGKIWLERDISIFGSGSSVFPVCMEIGRGEWIDTPIFQESPYPEVSYLEAGGIAYYASASTSTPCLSGAPGVGPEYHGKTEKVQGLAIDGQEDLNALTANLYAAMNAEYGDVSLKLRGNYANLDIAPQEMVALNVAANDTPRNIVFVDKQFAVQGVSWEWNDRDQVLLPSISLSEVTQGSLSETIIIPPKPPDGGDGGGGGHGGIWQPPTDPPSYPPPTGTVWVDVYENGTFIMRTRNLNFYGDRVTVDANLVAQGADITISDCDCPVNFPPIGQGYLGDGELIRYICEDILPWTAHQADLNHADVTIPGFSAWGPFSTITGSYTLQAEYTGLYKITVYSLAFGALTGQQTGAKDVCFDWIATLHMGNYAITRTGSEFFARGGVGIYLRVDFGDPDYIMWDVYLTKGDPILWHVDFTITDNCGSLDALGGGGSLLVGVGADRVTIDYEE